MARITAKQTESFLRRARREKGADYRDPGAAPSAREGCKYFNKDKSPSCIVGHVFHYAGVKPFSPNDGLNQQGVPELWYVINELFTETAICMLERAQNVQDVGGTWGAAVEEAIGRG